MCRYADTSNQLLSSWINVFAPTATATISKKWSKATDYLKIVICFRIEGQLLRHDPPTSVLYTWSTSIFDKRANVNEFWRNINCYSNLNIWQVERWHQLIYFDLDNQQTRQSCASCIEGAFRSKTLKNEKFSDCNVAWLHDILSIDTCSWASI